MSARGYASAGRSGSGSSSASASAITADHRRYKAFWFYKNVLDVDGNGYTNEDDFVRIALNHAVFFCKGAYFKDIYENYIETFQNIWRQLSSEADTNQDGIVCFEEWYAYLQRLQQTGMRSFEELPGYLREFIEHHFNAYDMNRDGQVDVNEYRLYLCGRNMDLKMAGACFDALLAGGDRAKGTINKRQFCALMFDFLFSLSPDSQGTFLCGPLHSVKHTAIHVYAQLALA
ncbi:sarcoplasmic calcium-binding protein, alpha chain-like [Paramacrobiotus metropolitanus]|uniref:sarcoplasmic calcium-binding protein, alpha chain-like n=1 Tax=Paramacrobiotus metropolitanus TaxID=2943436 RepID=UPI002445D094|nr:sarcoplasmic calcium-binding protein, alpha chain-like [Paramacrobiotus metropolitanus]